MSFQYQSLFNTTGGGSFDGDVSFTGTVSFPSLTPSLPLVLDASSNVTAAQVILTSQVQGVLPVANGGTGGSTALNNNRIMVSAAGAITEAAALTDGQLLVGSTAAAPVAAAIGGTANRVTVTNGAGAITLSGPQDIHTTATPTFNSLTLSTGLNALLMGTVGAVNRVRLSSFPLASGGDGFSIHNLDTANNPILLKRFSSLQLQNTSAVGLSLGVASGVTPAINIHNTGQGMINVVSTGDGKDTITITDAGVVGLPRLTASLPLQMDASSNIISQAVSLTSGVSGVLPIANGGTNASTALANGYIMTSQAGAVKEGTSTSQVFTFADTTDATTGGAGSLLCSGGIFASKKLVNGDNIIQTGTLNNNNGWNIGQMHSTTVNKAGLRHSSLPDGLFNHCLTHDTAGDTCLNASASAGSIQFQTGGLSVMTVQSALVSLIVGSQLKIPTATNQIVLSGGTRTLTLSAVQPATASRTVTFPDPGANGDVVYTVSGQTIGGAKTFTSAITNTATTNQLVLSGPTRTLTISAVEPASASRTITFQDPGANGDVVYTVSGQTIGGAKTFSASTTFSIDVAVTGDLTCKRYYAELYNTSGNAQTVADNTTTDVSFDTVANSANWGAIALNATTLTIPKTGWYKVWGQVRFAQNATGGRVMQFSKNNSTTADSYPVGLQPVSAAAFDTVINLSGVVFFTAADTVRIKVYQNSTGNLAIGNHDGVATWQRNRMGVHFLHE